MTRYLAYAAGEVVLIVVGVSLAVQLNSWVENRSRANLETAYLQRLSEEIHNASRLFAEEQVSSVEAQKTVKSFLAMLNNPDSPPEQVLSATHDYFSQGAYLPRYRPVTTTFDDLKSTGNLGVISNPDLRLAIIAAYGVYEANRETHAINSGWILASDTKMLQESDVLRWDNRTSGLLPQLDVDAEVALIRSLSEMLTRNAMAHFWIFDRINEQYVDSIQTGDRVLAAIGDELDRRLR